MSFPDEWWAGLDDTGLWRRYVPKEAPVERHVEKRSISTRDVGAVCSLVQAAGLLSTRQSQMVARWSNSGCGLQGGSSKWSGRDSVQLRSTQEDTSGIRPCECPKTTNIKTSERENIVAPAP